MEGPQKRANPEAASFAPSHADAELVGGSTRLVLEPRTKLKTVHRLKMAGTTFLGNMKPSCVEAPCFVVVDAHEACFVFVCLVQVDCYRLTWTNGASGIGLVLPSNVDSKLVRLCSRTNLSNLTLQKRKKS